MEKKVIQRITAIMLVIGLILTGCGGSGGASADAEQGRTVAEAQDSQAAETEDSRAMAPANQTQKAENAFIRMEAEDLPRDAREYTVLIYMVGSNLETNRGAATSDLEEMLASGIDFTGNNIIVYTGGARKWSSNIPCDRNCLLDLSKGSGSWLAGMTDGSSDMGAPETLTEFLNTAVENYPARHYCLIFWDHGSGPISGFGVDELFGNDSLQFGELRQAMDASPFGPGGSARLDWVGFDACLMGSLEHASLWKDYTDYMVASEELEPADGWDYSFLQTLNGTSDPVRIMEAAVNAYYDWYTSGTGNKVTLAAYDLTRAGAVAEAYAGLAARMAEDLDDGAYARIVQIRQKVLQFGTSVLTLAFCKLVEPVERGNVGKQFFHVGVVNLLLPPYGFCGTFDHLPGRIPKRRRSVENRRGERIRGIIQEHLRRVDFHGIVLRIGPAGAQVILIAF